MKHISKKPQPFGMPILAAGVVLALTACGGGDSTISTAPANSRVLDTPVIKPADTPATGITSNPTTETTTTTTSNTATTVTTTTPAVVATPASIPSYSVYATPLVVSIQSADANTVTGTLNVGIGSDQVVNIYDGNQRLEPAATVTGTTWMLTLSSPLAAGVHNLTAWVDQKLDGTHIGTASQPFSVTIAPSTTSSTSRYSLVSKPTGGTYSKAECVQVTDPNTKKVLVWEGKISTATYTNLNKSDSSDAGGYIQATNQNALCGRKNWRLPTIQELDSLVDSGKIDPTWLPTPNWYVWSSSGTDAVWGLLEGVSNTTHYNGLRSASYGVWLVSGQ